MNYWKNIKNILCVRLDNIGDILMTTPAFRAIKESNKHCKITILTSTHGKNIAKMIPEIDALISCNVPWVKNDRKIDSKEIFRLQKEIEQKKFDAAIIFTVYTQSPLPTALLCYLAEIPLRLAYCHENPYELLTHWIPDPEPSQYIVHETERQLELMKEIGYITQNHKLSLSPPNKESQIHELLKKSGIEIHSPWILIHPGATSSSRQFNPHEYAKIADELGKDFQIIFTGVENEQELITTIQKSMEKKSVSFAGLLSLEEFVCLISLSPLLIGNNSGPIHIAAAVQTPVIVLYALTNPQHTPWQVPHRVFYFDIPKKYIYNQQKPLSKFAYPLKNSQQVVKAAKELLKTYD